MCTLHGAHHNIHVPVSNSENISGMLDVPDGSIEEVAVILSNKLAKIIYLLALQLQYTI